MKRNNDFKIKEYHVFQVFSDELGWLEWEKLITFTSLSEAVKYARNCKSGDYRVTYRVVGEFNYEEI